MIKRIKHLSQRFSLILRSIRFRLALWFVLILGVVIVTFSGFIYIRQKNDLRYAAIARLEIKVQRLARFLRFSGVEYFQQAPARFPTDPVSGEPLLQEGDVLAIIDPDGQVLQDWGGVEKSTINQFVKNAVTSNNLQTEFGGQPISAFFSRGNSGADYVLFIAPISFGGSPFGYFLIGNPVDPGNQLPRLLISLILGISITLAIALLGGFWLADRAIHPVKIITQTARTISGTDLSRRIQINRKDELGELANTFDEMLARLQASFERQRQFTADASHELRTPLTIVELETSRGLAAQRSPQEYQNALKVIQAENQFMIRLVNNLLTLARMDAGQVVLQKQEVDLSELALDVVERLTPVAKKNEVKLVTGDLPELPLSGDRQHLVQMLSNLVENAIKHAKGTDKRVRVETGSRSTARGTEAWVRVIDNGPGIPPEHIPHLFDRFYQVDAARTRRDGDDDSESDDVPSGAGLGLSIAQWIARAHEGEIGVQSELGRGSVFEVSLLCRRQP